MGEVDAVEQHRELGGVELDAQRVVLKRREPKAALLEALVGEDEAATVPREDLHPVLAPGDEDEEVAAVDVLLPRAAHDGREPVDAVPHVHRLGGEEDPDRPWEQEHLRYPSAATSSAR